MFLRNPSFRERISRFLEEEYFEFWKYETGQNEVTAEWRFLARYHIQGFLAIIGQWIKNDYTSPKGKLVDMVLKVDTHFNELFNDFAIPSC